MLRAYMSPDRSALHHRRGSRPSWSTGVDGGEGDGLGPPARIGAVGEELVDEPVVEVALGREAGAQLGDRVDPVGGPGRAAIVDGGFGRARDLLQAQGGEARGEGTADVVVDPLRA